MSGKQAPIGKVTAGASQQVPLILRFAKVVLIACRGPSIVWRVIDLVALRLGNDLFSCGDVRAGYWEFAALSYRRVERNPSLCNVRLLS